MNTSAIVMLIVSVLIIWGGLALATLNLMRHGEHAPERSGLRRDL